jgi:CRISPR/Cas system-associated exonuclease Cas4 (RecB family)
MKSFLQELAEKTYRDHPKLDEVTIVFPNRRAVLYFRKHLSDLLDKPVFSPRLITIEDFIGGFSTLKVPDKLELIANLYQVYQSIVHPALSEEERGGVDEFYFWGDMLLRDFDEIDKYMVNAVQLFKDLSHQKELDSSFDFLTDEQKDFLKSFWGNFDETQSLNKKKFLYLWRQLPQVYIQFKKLLADRGLAFEGMLHRAVAEELLNNAKNTPVASDPSTLKFAGFNALTAAEEIILSFFVERGADVHWDMDAYYVNNETQEAGRFFREYQQHRVLKKTFPQDIPSHALLKTSATENSATREPIKIFGAAQPIGQAKLMAQVLKEQLAKGIKPEETLIVLPDEKLLLPVLHGIAGCVENLNVTMGFPLSGTPLFNFIELLIDLQITRKDDHFNHRQVLAVLGHPYVVAADAVAANGKRKEILRHNWVHIPKSFLATEVPIHRLIFKELSFSSDHNGLGLLIEYLKAITLEIGSMRTIASLDKEYAFHFHKFFNRLQEIFVHGDDRYPVDGMDNSNGGTGSRYLKSFLRLFRQLIRSHKIPFSGEPLKGLQVMGVLETRNLDFKNVFILSLNEGAFPAISGKGSYIPYTIRKAYRLPTVEHQDAIYAYLFYRVLQRAENISIFYNAETDVLGQGEMSRYLQQLLFESGLPIEKRVLHNPIEPQGINPIVIPKNEQTMESLAKLNEGNMYFKGISPSALNSYIECRLKFYFRYIAKVREPDEVEEELDARVLGNFLHDVMERFYTRITKRKFSRQIEASDFEDYDVTIDALIDEVFIEAYRLDPEKKVTYAGQRLVVKEIVKRFAHRIVEMDKAYAPFSIEALEQEGLTFTVNISHAPYRAVVGGKIDRVDRKGNILRVIDYKTGKDKLNFESIASLFARDAYRNKAAFQTLLYALLYKQNFLKDDTSSVTLVPGLINRMNLFDDGFSFGLKVGREQIADVDQLLPEFEAHLRNLFEELFDITRPFDQTIDTENCKNCPYSMICYR